MEIKKDKNSANRTMWKYLVKYDESLKAEYRVQGTLKPLEE
jgi:hypothetical protein